MTDPVDPFAGSAGNPSISFAMKDAYGNMTTKPIGTRIGGKVLKAPSLVQRRDFKSKEAEFWPDGNPKLSVVVDMNIDGTDMSLWVKKPSQMFKEFGEAIGRAGGVPVGPGATIFVTLTGFESPEADKAPAKMYRVEYTPANSFAGDASIPASNGHAPATTPEGYTLDSLISAGWTAAQIAASYPALIPVTAPVPSAAPPPPPPVPPAAPAPPAPPVATQSERDAKIAAMSESDRQLLGI